jgi:DNA-binding NarL/FixJ family response regulator
MAIACQASYDEVRSRPCAALNRGPNCMNDSLQNSIRWRQNLDGDGDNRVTAIIRVVIADDHPLMRAALREAVTAKLDGIEIYEAASVSVLVETLREVPDIDVVLLDLRMPDSKGFSALVQLRTQFPDIPVIVVSATEDLEAVDRALLLGASGYIVKSAPVETVGKALLGVLNGDIVRPPCLPAAASFQDEDLNQFRKLRTLTPQQFNVLVMIAEGHSNKQIASALQIAEATVKAHITALLLKLGLQRRTQAALLAQHALQLKGVVAGDEQAPLPSPKNDIH